MPIGTEFLKNIFDNCDHAVAHYVTDTLTAVMAAIGPVAHQCFILYVMLWGFAMYRGLIQEPILDGAFRLMRVGIILYFATNLGAYSSQISDNLVALPDYLAGVMGGSGMVDSSKLALDKILTDSINLGASYWEMGSILSNPGPFFYALMIWISTLICVGYAAFLMILSKVMLALLMAIGPAFILLLMFEGTKRFFDAWMGQAINYALVSAFAVGVIKLLFGMYLNAADGAVAPAIGGDVGIQNFLSMLLMSGICFLALMQVNGLASALGGGVAVSTLGAVSWAMGKGRSMAGMARPTSLQKAARTAQREYRAVKAGAQTAAAPVAWAARKVAGRGRNSISQ